MRTEVPPSSGYPGISLKQLERSDVDAWHEMSLAARRSPDF